MTANPGPCGAMRRRIHARHDGGETTPELAAHLDICAPCAKLAAELVELDSALLAAAEEPPTLLAAGILAAWDVEHSSPRKLAPPPAGEASPASTPALAADWSRWLFPVLLAPLLLALSLASPPERIWPVMAGGWSWWTATLSSLAPSQPLDVALLLSPWISDATSSLQYAANLARSLAGPLPDFAVPESIVSLVLASSLLLAGGLALPGAHLPASTRPTRR